MPGVRTTIVTSIMAPHRIALFNALSGLSDIDLSVVYLARSDPSRKWATNEEDMRYRHRVLREHARFKRGESYVHVNSGLLPELRRSRPDVVVAGGWDQIAYHEAYALHDFLGARLMWWVESNLRDRRPDGSSVRRLKRRLLRGVDGVVVPGTASIRYVQALGADPDRVWVAPNAVDNDFFHARTADRSSRSGTVRFLFVGRTESSKGIASLLDAWAALRIDGELRIVGSGSLEEVARTRVQTSDMPPVRFVTHLDRGELALAYADADVFVFPSVSDPWGLVINEAMASGLPVITTSAPGAVDDLVVDGDNGFVVPPHAPGPLVHAMRVLATDDPRRLEMGERSRQRIERFEPADWANGMRDAVLAASGTGVSG